MLRANYDSTSLSRASNLPPVANLPSSLRHYNNAGTPSGVSRLWLQTLLCAIEASTLHQPLEPGHTRIQQQDYFTAASKVPGDAVLWKEEL